MNSNKKFMQVAIELPYVCIQSLIYSAIFYFMASFEWNIVKFVWYIYFMYFTLLYFTFFGMMTIAVTPNHNIAAIVAAPFYMMWNLFSGFMIAQTVTHPQFLFLLVILCFLVIIFLKGKMLQKTPLNYKMLLIPTHASPMGRLKIDSPGGYLHMVWQFRRFLQFNTTNSKIFRHKNGTLGAFDWFTRN